MSWKRSGGNPALRSARRRMCRSRMSASIGPRSPCALGSPGNTRPRGLGGYASFHRRSSGMRYAGSGTVRSAFCDFVASSSRRRVAWCSTKSRLPSRSSESHTACTAPALPTERRQECRTARASAGTPRRESFGSRPARPKTLARTLIWRPQPRSSRVQILQSAPGPSRERSGRWSAPSGREADDGVSMQVESVRELQRPLDRLEAGLVAQGIQQRISSQVLQTRVPEP
jgi:hypothetical protein